MLGVFLVINCDGQPKRHETRLQPKNQLYNPTALKDYHQGSSCTHFFFSPSFIFPEWKTILGHAFSPPFRSPEKFTNRNSTAPRTYRNAASPMRSSRWMMKHSSRPRLFTPHDARTATAPEPTLLRAPLIPIPRTHIPVRFPSTAPERGEGPDTGAEASPS